MAETFFKIVDDNSFQVFYSLKTKQLILPSQFKGDPITQFVQTLVGERPDPQLHHLNFQGAEVSYYNLNMFKKELVLKDLFYRWMVGFDTPTFLAYVGPLVTPDLTDIVHASLFGAPEVTAGLKCYRALKTSFEGGATEVALRSDPTTVEKVRALSDWVTTQALEAL